ncbi:YfiH family protein [Methylohalomonas lacus]|uniref:Purine nucleoside phosphorylase n=1 Tax=Methylohalomonas lacus TaxID=398773 RepID=A0AAE3HM77_9GAMM|nr:peptidoglycan editing factor PgeF [Methylohalomonas lacus]MCS3903873.1 YfiH family protein [Methylohalomonas lacus]
MADTRAWLAADWPAPDHVHAGTTTRAGGYSKPPYASFNLAAHVGDDGAAVNHNRRQLQQCLQLPAEPAWLQQVHGPRVIAAHTIDDGPADASWTDRPGVVCAVLTADCLPLLLTDRGGSCVAVVHVGWRGLVAGVIDATVAALPAHPADLLAWLGPAIGPAAFEVGSDVRDACLATFANADSCFTRGRPGHWQADLPGLAERALRRAGVETCCNCGYCTYSDPLRFYSYRRDGTTGRMASLIWMDAAPVDYACR